MEQVSYQTNAVYLAGLAFGIDSNARPPIQIWVTALLRTIACGKKTPMKNEGGKSI